ncbi:DJ-1/PfpI family protein [Ilumatobacter sp.]|uniref:DJ-1/PfpI family protein n=1 Tax=Ilumatobacter sp. TaxID=1967498 RepID=UPI003B5181AC
MTVGARLRRVVDVLSERVPPASTARSAGPIAGRWIDDRAPTVGVLAYRGVSSGEIDLPVERLAERLGANVVLVGAVVGPVHAVEPSRSVLVGRTPATAPPVDVLVVPGGLGWRQVIDDPEISRWLRTAAESARAVLAISTGSLLLATVGHLAGRDATGHWLASAELAALGARVTTARTASDEGGRIVTASGALAAIVVVDDLADHVRWAPS